MLESNSLSKVWMDGIEEEMNKSRLIQGRVNESCSTLEVNNEEMKWLGELLHFKEFGAMKVLVHGVVKSSIEGSIELSNSWIGGS